MRDKYLDDQELDQQLDALYDDILGITDPLKRALALDKFLGLKKKKADSTIAVFKAGVLEGDLVDRADVEDFASDFAAAFRGFALRFADVHAHTLAQLDTADAVHAYLTQEMRKLLTSIREQIDAAYKDGGSGVPPWLA